MVFFNDLEPAHGFYPFERDLEGQFVWSRASFSLRRHSSHRYLQLKACYYGDEGRLEVLDGRSSAVVTLKRGWNTYLMDLQDVSGNIIPLRIDRVIPVSGDPRELGIMIRTARAVEDGPVAESLWRAIENKKLNEKEFAEGKTVLSSVPTELRISLETRCNINPPCAYCEWEWTKSEEVGIGSFTLKTLDSLGPFYSWAEKIVDCSYGEPLLNLELPLILAEFERAGKHFEMTTNGLLLDEERRGYFLGRDVTLYISLDASSPKTYGALRNDRFHVLTENMEALCREKRQFQDLPVVVVSFIAMRSNQSEFGDFLKMVRRIGVDAVKVRSLFEEGYVKPDSAAKRGFNYQKERLSPAEFSAFLSMARGLTRGEGIVLVADNEFGNRGPDQPLCGEPWKTLYVLHRGMLPCCYTKESFARLGDFSDGDLRDRIAHVFNDRRYQEVRAALGSGRLSEFCLSNRSCPLVEGAQREDRGMCSS